MADLNDIKKDAEHELFEQIDDVRAGMLGLENSAQHFQPMAPHCDRNGKSLWFYAKLDSDLVKAIGNGAKGHFIVVGKSQDFYACISGMMRTSKDRERIEQYWSTITAAWFKDGQDDPMLTMIEFKLQDAAIWASTGNPLAFGWEIAKANMTDETPDVGIREHVHFN